MDFDWINFLHLAYELVGKPGKRANREARLRTAISRAYYMAFTKARNHLVRVDKQPIPYGANPHEYVQTQFKYSRNDIRREIAKNLRKLRKYRNWADYEDKFPGSLADRANEALNLADQISAGLSRL